MAIAIAASVALVWCLAAWRIGLRVGYVDQPGSDPLKTHRVPAVPLGGVGVFLGLHAAALTRGDLDPVLFWVSAGVLVLGVVDDARGLLPVVRLGLEIMAAVALVAGTFGWDAGPARLAVSAALVVFAINAVNLYDGLDGLVGLTGIVASLGVALLAFTRDIPIDASLELAAALAGFLILAWHPARVFLGDAGAYVVGLFLSYGILTASEGDVADMLVVSALLGVFAIDLFVTLLRRYRFRRPLFVGDRSHIYDQLRDRGMSVPAIAVGSAITQAAVIGVVLLSDWLLPSWPAVAVLAVVGGGAVVLVSRLGYLRVDAA